MTRNIINLKRWNELMKNGVIVKRQTKFGSNYTISISDKVSKRYTPETVGKIEEEHYNLTTIECTPAMFNSYVRLVGMTVKVDDDKNPYEEKYKFYIPEWMFEDRQDDLDNLYNEYEEE